MPKPGYLYILANRRNGTLYIGVTTDLVRRAFQHHESVLAGFSKSYGLRRLVHYEAFDDIRDAIGREKQLKKWRRNWKIRLIEESNPYWRDLSAQFLPGTFNTEGASHGGSARGAGENASGA